MSTLHVKPSWLNWFEFSLSEKSRQCSHDKKMGNMGSHFQISQTAIDSHCHLLFSNKTLTLKEPSEKDLLLKETSATPHQTSTSLA